MNNRPLPKYSMKICKDYVKNTRKYIVNYKNGGAVFGDDVKKLVGNIPNRMKAIIGGRGGVYSEWIYVGDGLWCFKGKSKYEFGRLMAVYIVGDDVIIDGPWDNDRHHFISPPEIVFDRDDVIGHIIGYNEFEIVISWFVNGKFGIGVPYSRLNNIRFKYFEDFKKYSKVLGC